jgi:hypothetical protein
MEPSPLHRNGSGRIRKASRGRRDVAHELAIPFRAHPKGENAVALHLHARDADAPMKRASNATDAQRARAEANRKHALEKKRRAQRDALADLERFLLDRVEVGLGSLDGEASGDVQSLRALATRMLDDDLRGPHAALLRLAARIEDDVDDGHDRRLADGFTSLWVLARRGIKAMEDPSSEVDPTLDTRLGRTWKRAELLDRGWSLRGASLVELDDDRGQDEVLAMDVQRGYWLDLASGAIYLEWMGLPFFASRAAIPVLRRSRDGVVLVREAALDPGDAINRRIRWDAATEPASERPLNAEDLRAVARHAVTFDVGIARLRGQLSDPGASADAVFLLDVRAAGTVGESLVIEDGRGARLVVRDPPGELDARSTVEHGLAAFGPGPLAARLWFDPDADAVFAQGLSLWTGDQRVRLRA